MRSLVHLLLISSCLVWTGCDDDSSEEPAETTEVNETTDTASSEDTEDSDPATTTPGDADDSLPEFGSCEEILDYCRDNTLPFPDCNEILEANDCPPIPGGGGGAGGGGGRGGRGCADAA